MARDTSKHNPTCFACERTFSIQYNKTIGRNQIGEWIEGNKCQECNRAIRESLGMKVNKFTWKSLKEIDATWGQVKEGQEYEQAVAKFAEALPVDDSMKKRFREVFNAKA